MRILIAYDGSACSDAAIVDLRRAGLPEVMDAVVLAVAEGAPGPMMAPFGAMVAGPGMIQYENLESESTSSRLLQDAQGLADRAADRLRADFPGWKVHTEAWIDTAAAAIIRKAHGWKPDLIVVGSHGRTGVSRLMLGSVSHHVLNHVTGSVRISRHALHGQDRPIRVVIGVDGSENAKAAVLAAGARSWPPGTEMRVVGVADSRTRVMAGTTLEGTVPAEIEREFQRALSEAVRQAAGKLAKPGFCAEQVLVEGIPVDSLLAEAERWGADCIFLGARGIGGLDRIMLGSVALGVAARAHCSVEIVRPSPR